MGLWREVLGSWQTTEHTYNVEIHFMGNLWTFGFGCLSKKDKNASEDQEHGYGEALHGSHVELIEGKQSEQI